LAAGLPTGKPEAHSFLSAELAKVLLGAKASGAPIHSLLIVRGGEIVLDADFYPYDSTTLHDMASVTKSVTTSLVGIAAGEGRLDLDAPMLSFFPGRDVANRDARKERITVRQLTRNLSGLACIGYPEEVTLAQMEASADFVQFALDLPAAFRPGRHFDYCSPGMHLLSAILQQATGMTAAAYAEEKIFKPLGIVGAAWDTDPQGITRGWGDLHLTPHDMAKLGLMWMHGGVWEGQQIIPADWLRAATTEAVKSDRYEDYGAGFWIGPKDEPIPYFLASGRGGQRILPVAALDLVIVTTGGGFDSGSVVDALANTVTDWSGTPPADAEGEAALAAAVAAVAAPPAPQPVQPLPPIAAQIDGKVFRLAENPYNLESLKLEFPGQTEALITLAAGGGAIPRPAGLDGVYRWSPGPNGIRYGQTAHWRDDTTLVVDHNTIGDIRAYTITAHFAGDSLELTIDQRDEPSTLRLTGTAE
jgi:CubicO group peptidase (beta-lactamase class C family)